MCQVCGFEGHVGVSRRGLLGGAVATFVSTVCGRGTRRDG